jgi:uncharacterized protein (TIGR02145 family)
LKLNEMKMKNSSVSLIVAVILLTALLISCETEVPVTIPAPPSSLEAIAVSTSQIDLSWTDNSDNETGFVIERKTEMQSYASVATKGIDENKLTNSGLSENTNYSYRVYAINSEHGSGDYTNEVNVTTLEALKVTDVDGNDYPVVSIGTQFWMAENLKTTRLKDETMIPLVSDDLEWNRSITPAYSWYNNDQSNYGETYGALYNWYTASTGDLCPSGWHVPSDAEWTTLINFLGGDDVAGGKLKEGGTTHWSTPNTGGSNESGFRALPGGYHNSTGSYNLIGEFGRFWTSTEKDGQIAMYRVMGYNTTAVNSGENSKSSGFSIRCVMD